MREKRTVRLRCIETSGVVNRLSSRNTRPTCCISSSIIRDNLSCKPAAVSETKHVESNIKIAVPTFPQCTTARCYFYLPNDRSMILPVEYKLNRCRPISSTNDLPHELVYRSQLAKKRQGAGHLCLGTGGTPLLFSVLCSLAFRYSRRPARKSWL